MPDLFDEARHQVLIANTAQTVFNHLEQLEHQRKTLLSRWVWELLQNARDASANDNPLRVSIVFDRNTLIFRHNGSKFKIEEVTHLIYHGSTKKGSDNLGQFGTGFLSTHLLSKRIRVRGQFQEGGVPFDFTLFKRKL